MEWTKRKIFILYVTFLLICFCLGGVFLPKENKVQYEILCDNGEIDTFNYSDKYICGGYPNPLRKNIIETNISLYLDKFK